MLLQSQVLDFWIYGGYIQMYAEGSILSVSDYTMTYNVDTEGGQRSSPIFKIQNGQLYNIGIYTTGNVLVNSGVRINTSIINLISSNN